MSRKMGPTAEFVGPADCAQTQAVARPTPHNLVNQLVREPLFCTHQQIHPALKNRWIASTLLGWVILFGAGACVAQLNNSVDPYTSEFEKSPPVDYYLQEKIKQAASTRQEHFRKRVSIKDAIGDNVPQATPRNFIARKKQIAPAAPLSDSHGIIRQGILLIVLFFLSAVLFIRLLAPELFKTLLKKLNPWALKEQSATNLTKVRAEEAAFGEFLANFQTGPRALAVNLGVGADDSGAEATNFSATAARLLVAQRIILQSINRTTEIAARRRMLADLGREIHVFKGAASAPGFLPAWQLACALEGLLKQLLDKASNVTLSTLRTVGGAVDLLEELSQPKVEGNLLTDPPLKFLAVDDDMISRTAISFALKKALNQPDLADSGMTALALVTRQTYDVIFLDVQMPGMDGFELCAKIHETVANQHTPVVFVTSMSDFDARAQSVLTGGTDLLGKPFLTFEITVKALTLALSRRLHASNETSSKRGDIFLTSQPQKTVSSELVSNSLKSPVTTDCRNLAIQEVSQQATNELSESLEIVENAFLTRATPQVETLRDQIRLLGETTDKNIRQETLAEIYLGLHSLSPQADSAGSHPAMRLSVGIEGLIKKLLENPQNWTSSMQLTLTNAVNLMDDLCGSGVLPELAPNSPIHILVVDDDLLSRRAINCALQMAFEKPESAESGIEGVARATENSFDLIFLDVQMPGMDGFTACEKIRQTQANRDTPVVFVTSQTDFNTRAQAATSGGDGLIAKPFLVAEVTLKALTFVLRGRLQKNVSQKSAQISPQKPVSKPTRESRRSRKRRSAPQTEN